MPLKPRNTAPHTSSLAASAETRPVTGQRYSPSNEHKDFSRCDHLYNSRSGCVCTTCDPPHVFNAWMKHRDSVVISTITPVTPRTFPVQFSSCRHLLHSQRFKTNRKQEHLQKVYAAVNNKCDDCDVCVQYTSLIATHSLSSP